MLRRSLRSEQAEVELYLVARRSIEGAAKAKAKAKAQAVRRLSVAEALGYRFLCARE